MIVRFFQSEQICHQFEILPNLTQTFPGESIELKFIPSPTKLFPFIPISVSDPMRIIPNQSDKRFVSRLMKNGHKSFGLKTWFGFIRIDALDCIPLRINPNESGTNPSDNFNLFKSIRSLEIKSDYFKIQYVFDPNKFEINTRNFSIRVNPFGCSENISNKSDTNRKHFVKLFNPRIRRKSLRTNLRHFSCPF